LLFRKKSYNRKWKRKRSCTIRRAAVSRVKVSSMITAIPGDKTSIDKALWLGFVFLLNVPTFGLFGLHYLYLAAIYNEKRLRYLGHFALYCIGAGLFALGIWCRTKEAGYHECNDGAEMSRDCLWNEQRTVYQLNYTLHYLGAGFCMVHVFFDLCSMPLWLRDVYNNNSSLSLFWASSLIRSTTTDSDNYYLMCISICWLCFSLTWMFFYDWSTLDGLGGLAAALWGQIFGWYAMFSIYFNCIYKKQEGEGMKDGEHSDNDNIKGDGLLNAV
jgi:hypothetical protein